eukprot:Blabericola_migrator_1__107@NODE_1027_length_5664_cov_160_198321_g707_i0_p1_GENE_NODE_1027_length_5664_cov_160_198321_g707_i0NODE_1027_length_5664_cov_160_198321_g707_i0_p1_ORF_typecomplete_len1136_score167_20Sec23_trunk/PF04811_15/7_6e23Sec23_helical/PF04815_15/3e17Sec23_BS/PF08033_12/1_6e08zfSec23_Sec24/PF04810_15/3_8e05Gelsolin/PF00626_22/0_007_NODE_1027_length_5664_cov_160_198321_g707_i021865593
MSPVFSGDLTGSQYPPMYSSNGSKQPAKGTYQYQTQQPYNSYNIPDFNKAANALYASYPEPANYASQAYPAQLAQTMTQLSPQTMPSTQPLTQHTMTQLSPQTVPQTIPQPMPQTIPQPMPQTIPQTMTHSQMYPESQYYQRYQQEGDYQQSDPSRQPFPSRSSPTDKAKDVSTLAKSTDSRIDAQQIPRPMYKDIPSEPGGRRYEPDHPGAPPPSTTFCTFMEDIDAIPRYIRSSLMLVPQSRQTFNTSKIPFFIVSTPFTALAPYECKPPKIDLSPFSPLFTHLVAPHWNYSSNEMFTKRPSPPRCSECSSYVNAHWQFAQKQATCPMCGKFTILPEWYANALAEHCQAVQQSQSGYDVQRTDLRKALRSTYDLNEANNVFASNAWIRPELLRGTVDYATHAHPHPRLRPAPPLHVAQAAVALLSGASPARPHSNPPGADLPYQGAGFCQDVSYQQEHMFLDANAGYPPMAPVALVYLVDISSPALRSRFSKSALTSIRATLRRWPATQLDLCVVLFHDSLIFTPKSAGSGQLRQRHIVGDVTSPFLPASAPSLFHRTTVGEDTEEDEALLDYFDGLEELLDAEEKLALIGRESHENCSSAALCAGIELLLRREHDCSTPINPVRGGCINLFTTSHPTVGIGAVETHAPPALAAPRRGASATTPTEKVGNPYIPKRELRACYSEIYRRCVTHGVSVNAFVGGGLLEARDPHNHIDLGTLGYLPLYTGGRTFYYPKFSTYEYHEEMYYNLFQLFAHPVAFDCAYKIRISKGLVVSKILCPWSCIEWESGGAGRDASTFMVPFMGTDSTVCFEVNYAENQLDTTRNAVIVQTACAYTTWTGERRLRISTKKFGTSNSLVTTFRHADVEPVVMGYARQIFLGVLGDNQKVRDAVSKNLTDMLYSYRINAAINSPPGQLILPESLKLLPIYLTGLFKSKALRLNCKEDDRVAHLFALLCAGCAKLTLGLYPIVIPLHRSYKEVPRENLSRMGLPTDVENFVYVPNSVPSSGERITTDGVFLMDNGEVFYVYVGKDIKATALGELLPEDLDVSQLTLFRPPESPNPQSLGNRVQAVINQLRLQKFNLGYQAARVIKAGHPPESEFIWHLVENRLGSEKGYVDYLCQLHRTVQQLMDES